jgi:hypothetical protein
MKNNKQLFVPLRASQLAPCIRRSALRALRLTPGALRSAFCALALFLGSLSGAWADVQEQLSKLHPYIAIQGLYDSNIYLTQDNPTSDFITTITPGLKYVAQGAAYNFDLGFELGMNFYASNPDLNYISYDGRLDTFYSFNPRWTMRLYDSLTRSRNNLQSYTLPTATGSQTVTSSSASQDLYLRNIFRPTLEYKFGRENLVALSYLNMIYRTDGDTNSGDSTGNTIAPQLTYWFNIRHGMTLDYAYTNATFVTDPDWTGNSLGGRYLYRFNPRTTAFADYRYANLDYEFPGRDYSVQAPSLGVDHTFNPSLTGHAQFGWFWQVVDAGPSFNGPVINFSVTQRVQRTRYTVAFESGYREQFFTADNLGFSKYYQATATVSHQLLERLSVKLTGTLSRDEYQAPDQIDTTSVLAVNLSYQPLKWLNASLEAGNYSRDSDLNGNSYRDNRVSLRIKAEY